MTALLLWQTLLGLIKHDFLFNVLTARIEPCIRGQRSNRYAWHPHVLAMLGAKRLKSIDVCH